MKKVLIIISILLIQLQAQAFEDYIVLSDLPVKHAYSKDESVFSVEPFYTIDNKKNTLVLKSKSEGKTTLVIENENADYSTEVTVTDKETIIQPMEGFSFFVLDIVDKPEKPILREGK